MVAKGARRRRLTPGRARHRAGQAALSLTVSDSHGDRSPREQKAMRRRLQRLAKEVSPALSASQWHWLEGNLEGDRFRQALESLARWTVGSGLPVSPAVREEFLSLAVSLGVKGTVLGILHSHDGERGPSLHPRADGTGGVDVPLAEFERLVADAIDSLPDEFRKAMTNVVITVEEEAEGRGLFGLYVGVPLTKRYYGTWFANPDQIFIYRRTICAHCRTEDEVRALVHKTVIHEIAHHFGIGDPRLEELGWG